MIKVRLSCGDLDTESSYRIVAKHRGYEATRLEADTCLRRDGADSGLPQHCFDQAGLRDVLVVFRVVTLEELVRELQGPDGERRLSCHWAVVVERV